MNTKLIETKSGTFSIIDTDTDAQAVIFLSGLGSFAYDFHFTIKDIESKFRCVAIDRLGLGDSSEPEMLRTANIIAEEINTLLETLEIKNAIFVAHDSGSIYARRIAELFPDKVRSLLLVDPVTEKDDKFEELNIPVWHSMASIKARIDAMIQYKGIDRDIHKKMLKAMADIMYERFPDDIKEKVIEYNSDKKCIETIIREFNDRGAAFAEVGEKPLHIPVWVLMRDPAVMIAVSVQYDVPQYEAKIVEELWLKNIYDMMNLSERSRLIESKGTDHNMPLNSPILIADYIREIDRLK